MLLDGADPLFESLDSFMELTVRELDERASFPELIIQMLPILGMTPVEVHLVPFRHKLDLAPKFLDEDAVAPLDLTDVCSKGFRRNIGVPFDPGDVRPKGFGRGTDDLLNLSQRFLIHTLFSSGAPRLDSRDPC